jgi:hypothetical protein
MGSGCEENKRFRETNVFARKAGDARQRLGSVFVFARERATSRTSAKTKKKHPRPRVAIFLDHR